MDGGAWRLQSMGLKESDVTEQLYFHFYISLHLPLNSSKTIFILKSTKHCHIFFVTLCSVFGFLSRPQDEIMFLPLVWPLQQLFVEVDFLGKRKHDLTMIVIYMDSKQILFTYTHLSVNLLVLGS